MVGEDVATDGLSAGPASRAAAGRVAARVTWPTWSPGRCLTSPGRGSGLAAGVPRRGRWRADAGPGGVSPGSSVSGSAECGRRVSAGRKCVAESGAESVSGGTWCVVLSEVLSET